VTFESWSQKNVDVVRRKRLLLGTAIGATLLVGSGTALVLSSSQAAAQVEEEAKIVEVQLAKEPEPEPEPEPPPPPPELKQHKPNPGPRLPKLETPTEISQEKPDEKEAKPSDTGGDPYEKGGGDGSSGPQKTVVEAPTPPPPPPAPVLPKLKTPRPVSENDTPPEPIGTALVPEYPAAAKAAGLEGVVIVKFVVTETGQVTDVRVLKGPPEFHEVCIAAVKARRYKPGRDADGVPFPFTKIVKFPFRLRT
jgi:protein TonB